MLNLNPVDYAAGALLAIVVVMTLWPKLKAGWRWLRPAVLKVEPDPNSLNIYERIELADPLRQWLDGRGDEAAIEAFDELVWPELTKWGQDS